MKTLALVFAAAALLCSRAIADTPITRVPFTITVPGNYYLPGNLAYSGSNGAAITINASEVVLDLQEHRLVCGAPPSNAAVGIAAVGRNNLVIRNGSIFNFKRAVQLTGAASQRATIEKLILVANREIGIWVEGQGMLIRDNTISNTGSGLAAGDISTAAVGIYSLGDGVQVVNNTVVDTYRPNTWNVGILTYGGIIQGNRITNRTKGGAGIWAVAVNMNAVALENCVVGFNIGVTASGNVMYRKNTCYGCGTAVTGGVDGGDNR